MGLNFRTVLVGCMYHCIRIQITGALFFGLSSNINRVGNYKRRLEKSHSPYILHHPSQRQFASEDLGNYAKRKRFYEYNPVAFRSNNGDSGEGRNSKRFFHFSPFITSFDNDRKSWTPKSKPKHEHNKMFVDHFTGLLPSSLHTSNKKFTNDYSTNNGFRRTGSYVYENNDSGRVHMNGATKQHSDTSFGFTPDTLEDDEYETRYMIQTTTPEYNSKSFDTNSFGWLKDKLATDSNKHTAQNTDTKTINLFDTPDVPSSKLDEDGDFDIYALEWLNDKITTHADTSENIFHQIESTIDSKQQDRSNVPFLNIDNSYDQNNDSPFQQNNAHVKQSDINSDQTGFGTIELRNHDSIHSEFDKFDDIPVTSEFVNPSNNQIKLTDINGHLPDSFVPMFGDYNDMSVYQDQSIPYLNSWKDDEIKPHVGVGSFISDNEHCADIDTRICSGDWDCSCYGMYTCRDMRCLSFESILAGAVQPTEIPEETGQWFDTPYDSWTK